ncbi:MAG: prepilin peptidase [Candidatus Babeliaceae bacterium]
MVINSVLVFLFALLWGSFLNALAYRLLYGHSLLKRSFCPHCNTTIAWYDLFPLLSWLILKGHCRFCKKPISWLYPFIELLTALSLTLLYLRVPLVYFSAYSFFFSLLIVCIRTDFEDFAILNHILYCIPIGWLASFFGLLPLSWIESLAASILGYSFLWIIRFAFWKLRQKEGLGLGDLDLLALIGAFTGIFGMWITLLLGSLSGSLAGLSLIFFTGNRQLLNRPIPFGPFLALGALLYVLFKAQIIYFFGFEI